MKNYFKKILPSLTMILTASSFQSASFAQSLSLDLNFSEIHTVPSRSDVTLAKLKNFEDKGNQPKMATWTRYEMSKVITALTVRFEKVDSISEESHSIIEPEIAEHNLILTLKFDDVALKNPELMAANLDLLLVYSKRITNSGGVLSPLALMETFSDAKAGSLSAQLRLKKIEAQQLENAQASVVVSKLGLDSQLVVPFTEAIAKRLQNLENEIPSLEKKAAAYERSQQKKLALWRKETQALEKYEAMDKKLNDLVLNNDRKGVRKMLETYLPWAVMEPAEIKAWQGWLEAIEHPDWNNTTLAYRGLSYDTDKLQRLKLANGQERIGMFSTVLTKNQGSYTRRLRSLLTNREKNGDLHQKNFKDNFKDDPIVVKMVDQMAVHDNNPVASSFLSFSNDPEIATRFMGAYATAVVTKDKKPVLDKNGKQVVAYHGALVAVKIDSRRMIPNLIAVHFPEMEILAPLIVFPDEILVFQEREMEDVSAPMTQVKFMENVKAAAAKSNIELEDKSSVSTMMKYEKDGMDFIRSINGVTLKAVGGSCNQVFL